MSLQNKIQKIIDVINNSNIEEIEISSFWGAQKIRLSKSKKNTQTPTLIKKPIVEDISVFAGHDNNLSDEKIILEKNTKNQEVGADSNSIASENAVETSQVVEEDLEYQKAPLVGTFYLSSKQGEPPFISLGDIVSKGQTLCIIEAMKIFNEIESDFDGEVVEILVDDESPVEFNQEIFSIRPN